MRCPYCGQEMGELPVEAIRASMRGPRMLEIFDAIRESGDHGIALNDLVEKVYGVDDRRSVNLQNHNSLKVTMIRLKERVAKHGWVIESGTATDSATERVYRIKRGQDT